MLASPRSYFFKKLLPTPLEAIVRHLLIALPAGVLAFLEARVVDAPLVVLLAIAVAVAVVWTGLATLVAARLRPTPTRAAAAAGTAVVAATMLLAPGVVLHLMFGAPADYLAVQQSPAGLGTVGYYATLNPLMEWVLVPLALYLAWPDRAARRPALAAATLFYLERAATYLYFAPAILAWPGTPTTPALLAEVDLWLRLDWTRVAVDALAVALFARAALAYSMASRPVSGAAPSTSFVTWNASA
jgi:hypothetical protein